MAPLHLPLPRAFTDAHAFSAGARRWIVRLAAAVALSGVFTGRELRARSDPGLQAKDGEARALLLRAVGPSLRVFSVDRALSDPRLTLYDAAKVATAENDDWSAAPHAAEIASTGRTLGAFPLLEGSRDAALLATVAPGAYTAHVRGASGAQGIVLVELYNVTPAGTRMINLSARADAGTGEDLLIAGFSIAGDGARTLLIRAVGPSLQRFGVDGVLTDPMLTLFEGQTPILANDDWTSAPDAADLLAASDTVGAFPLLPDSRDAAMLVTLMPGTYSAQVRGSGDTTGHVLVEIYAVP